MERDLNVKRHCSPGRPFEAKGKDLKEKMLQGKKSRAERTEDLMKFLAVGQGWDKEQTKALTEQLQNWDTRQRAKKKIKKQEANSFAGGGYGLTASVDRKLLGGMFTKLGTQITRGVVTTVADIVGKAGVLSKKEIKSVYKTSKKYAIQ